MSRRLPTVWLLVFVLAAACGRVGPPGSVEPDGVLGDLQGVDALSGGEIVERDGGTDAERSETGTDAAEAETVAGSPWRELPWTTEGDLRAAWGRSFSTIVAVGDDGAVVRFNGRWAAPLDVGTDRDLFAIDGVGRAVAMAGEGGTLLVGRDDGGFVPIETGVNTTLRGVAMRSAGDLLVVGDAGTLLHVSDGQAVAEASNSTAALLAVWAGPDGDAAVLDEAGGVLRRVNGVWLRTQVVHGAARLSGVSGVDALHLLVAGQHGSLSAFDGLGWTALLSNDVAARDLSVVRVLPDGEAWAAGAGGVLLTRAAGADFDAPFGLVEVLGPALADADLAGLVVDRTPQGLRGLAVGARNAVLVNAGDGWRDGSLAPGRTLRDAVALPDGSLLAVGDDGLVARSAHDRWTALPLAEARDLDGVALAADGASVWMGAGGDLLRLDLATHETTGVALDQPGRVRAIAGGLVAGDGALLGRLESDGTLRPLAVPAGVGRLHAAASCDGADWAAGDAGVLLRVRGDLVERVAVDTIETLRGLCCGEGGAIAAGENGVVVSADEHGGRVVHREPGALLQAAAWHAGAAWLAGLDGVVLRGAPDRAWTRVDLPVPLSIEALVSTSDGRLVALGVNARAYAREGP